MPKPKLARPVDIFNFRLTSLALFSLFLSFCQYRLVSNSFTPGSGVKNETNGWIVGCPRILDSTVLLQPPVII